MKSIHPLTIAQKNVYYYCNKWDDNDTKNSDSDFLVDPNPIEEVHVPDTKISPNAMSSTNVSGTMRFTGCLGGHKLKILLYGGSDDSFIQPRVVNFLQLEVLPTTP